MVNQVRGWQERQIEDDYAKLVIYRAFVEGELEAPKFLARKVPIVTSILLTLRAYGQSGEGLAGKTD